MVDVKHLVKQCVRASGGQALFDASRRWWLRARFPGSRTYWENRYAGGGSSGVGSYGQLAEFKAGVLNEFVAENGVRDVIEFGCGDGNQLRLAEYPRYVGLDVSRTAVAQCKQLFGGDGTKSFFLYDPELFVDNMGLFHLELALSIDVIYHLVEDRVFALHLTHLFDSASRFVIVYSSNEEVPAGAQSPHVKHRRFTDWVERNRPMWRLARKVPNRYGDASRAQFFIFEKAGDGAERNGEREGGAKNAG